jgi:hypothetical protein
LVNVSSDSERYVRGIDINADGKINVNDYKIYASFINVIDDNFTAPAYTLQ